MTPTLPPSSTIERARLEALRRLDLLDTPNEEQFDELTSLAATVLEAPIALVSLVDAERQWFKSCVGLEVRETPRNQAFCAHAIQSDELMEVCDATVDPRFADNPLVTSAPNIRFYAGAPLRTTDGHRLGTLCVIDRVPRKLTAEQRVMLQLLARQVVRLFETRRAGHQAATEATMHEALLRSVPLAIVATAPDGVVTHSNAAATRMLGWSESELVGRETPLVFFDHEEIKARSKALSTRTGQTFATDLEFFVELISRGATRGTEWTFVRKDGHRFPALLRMTATHDASGRLVGYLGIAEDVTGQKAALDQLCASEDRFRALAVSAPIGIYFADANGRCVYTNPRWQEIAGLSESEALGEGWINAIPAEDREELAAQMKGVFSGNSVGTGEFRMGQPSKPLRWVQGQASAVFGADGEVTGLVGVIEDITARREAQAATARQLQEKETLLREIHHRVKNNLQIVSSLLHFQSKRVADPRDLAAFQEGRDRLRSMMLVHETLYRSRDLAHVELGHYLRKLAEDLTSSYSLDAPACAVRADVASVTLDIEQALPLGMITNELLTNAFKYAFPFGRRGTVSITAVCEDHTLRLTVADDGVGIPEDFDLNQPSAFGWQLIRSLAGQLGAEVTCTRSPGTTVVVSVPLGAGARAAA